MNIRPIKDTDRQQWEPLWQGYLEFYETSLSNERTELTWKRFFDAEHVFCAYVAEVDGMIVGMVHAMML